jgi:hypothetical protein
MHPTKKDNYSNFLKIGCKLDTKINHNESYKYKSDKSLPNIICNQFNKSLITGIISNLSTDSFNMNSIKEKKNIKRKIRICSDINHEYIDEFIDNKNKVFDALENLIINDDVNNDNNNSDNNNISKCSDNNSSTNELQSTDNSKSKKKKKKKKNISVPKLNFTDIYNDYHKMPLFIHEVKYISKHNNDDCINNNCHNMKSEHKRNRIS